MNDPTTSLNAPPPRYLLESDSEDEEGQGIYPGSGPSRPRIRVTRQPVAVHWDGQKKSYDNVVIGVGQTGKYLLRKTGAQEDKMRIQRGGEVLGQGFEIGSGLLLHVMEVENDGIWEIAKAISEGAGNESFTVITAYPPALYIADPNSSTPQFPPIRYLSTAAIEPSLPRSILPVNTPNFITGLPAALATLSVHPQKPKIDITILSLPLPLSYLSTSSLIEALSVLAPTIGTVLSSQRGKSETKWEEQDDEPYSEPGMGGRKVIKKDLNNEDIGGMYM